ncbi:hypothetical protein Y695_02624 [Hydrogenophaga sp. T4]|nr:hypothetical protein Y695_02624 [Hydrogenophaga sp. T4]
MRRRSELSAWKKRVKRRSRVSGSMPMPVSRTVRTTPDCPSGARVSSAITLPSGVNLMALLIRLNRIWRRRVASAMTHPGRSAAAYMFRLRPLSRAATCIRPSTSCNTPGRWIGANDSLSVPDSRVETSRMSLSTPSRCSAESRAVPR